MQQSEQHIDIQGGPKTVKQYVKEKTIKKKEDCIKKRKK